MNLLVADLTVVKTMSTKGLLPLLSASGRRVLMWDSLAYAILGGTDVVACRWLEANYDAVGLVETRFTVRARRTGRRPEPVPERDYWSEATGAASQFMPDPGVSRNLQYVREALAEERRVRVALRLGGIRPHEASWLEERR